MKEISVTVGKTYAVTTAGSCTVTDADGRELCTAESGSQSYFTANGRTVTISDDSASVTQANFKQALAALGLLGGGIPSWLRTLKKELTSLLDKGNFELKFDNAAQKITISLYYDVLHLREQVDSLIERVVPQNLEVEITELPIGYTRVEYLDSIGSSAIIWGVAEPIKNPLEVEMVFYGGGVEWIENNFCGQQTSMNNPQWWFYSHQKPGHLGFRTVPSSTNVFKAVDVFLTGDTRKQVATFKNGVYTAPDGSTHEYGNIRESSDPVIMKIFGGSASNKGSKIASVYFKTGEKVHHYIAALDNTGAPCMFDLVTRKAFYNRGTGDFLYPGKEQEATTYSLRRPRMYAQMTEHGIRRLYHVPKGYNGTKEEYAAEHGFKLLVETPQPEEGYWAPVWHDREDCIELEWVETEPPAEEFSTEA